MSDPRANRWSSTFGWVGAGLLGLFAVLALASPWIAPYRPEALAAPGLRPPSRQHLLGTNIIGQDLASQLLVGARTSLLTGLLAGFGTLALGTFVGVTAGWVGRWVDVLFMRITDVTLALPRLPLLMLLGAYVGTSLAAVVMVITLLFWPGTARTVRAQVQSLRRRPHVRAALGFGEGSRQVLARHVVPELGLLLVAALIAAAARAVLLEAGLAFLGLGDPGRTSWGSMIREAREVTAIFYTDIWLWWLLPPLVAIVLVLLGMTFLGVAVEHRLNPRLSRHAAVGT